MFFMPLQLISLFFTIFVLQPYSTIFLTTLVSHILEPDSVTITVTYKLSYTKKGN